MNRRALIFALALLTVVTTPVTGQAKKTKIFVSDVSGSDAFGNERFKSLFMANLMKVKNVELVTRKEDAELIVEAIAKVEGHEVSSVGAFGNVVNGRSGYAYTAVLSGKVFDANGGIVFIGNKSTGDGQKAKSH
jgi:hypothetical protein